jgi:hypothetical protein
MLKLKDAARKSGLFIVSDSDLDFNQPVVRVKIDRSKASDLGITMAQVGNTLATLLGGNYVNRFNLEGRSYQVIPQVPRGKRLSPEALGGYYVATATGQQVPLSTMVSIETGTDPNALTHYNQLNSATFQAVPMPGVTVGQAVDFLEGEAKKLPAGFSHDYLADSRQYVQEGNQLAITFGFALIIIFLVLAAQFESLRDPLVIMISVPMAIVGALIPLFFGAATMNIYTQVGLLTLVGLISKHGILMVEFANELQLNEGLDKRSAIEMAARVRLRPILMTTAAMVTGLMPLLTATGAGAASRFSIGLVVVAGMSIGTLFTLFVLPAVYVAIATDHRAKPPNRSGPRRSRISISGRRRSSRPRTGFAISTCTTSRRWRSGASSTAPPIRWRAAMSVRRSIRRPSRRFTRSRSRAEPGTTPSFVIAGGAESREGNGAIPSVRALPRPQPGRHEREGPVHVVGVMESRSASSASAGRTPRRCRPTPCMISIRSLPMNWFAAAPRDPA